MYAKLPEKIHKTFSFLPERSRILVVGYLTYLIIAVSAPQQYSQRCIILIPSVNTFLSPTMKISVRSDVPISAALSNIYMVGNLRPVRLMDI